MLAPAWISHDCVYVELVTASKGSKREGLKRGVWQNRLTKTDGRASFTEEERQEGNAKTAAGAGRGRGRNKEKKSWEATLW